jgi:dihydroneopterin triphosphate diphosphatase
MAEPYKIPESVLVVIYTKNLDVLLIERADVPGFWQSVTGSIEPGDGSLRQTAIREVWEEAGLDATLYPLTDWEFSQTYEIFDRWRHRYAPGVSENLEHVFGLELPQIMEVTLSPREHTAYKWVSLKDAADLVFSWTNTEAIKRLAIRHGFML